MRRLPDRPFSSEAYRLMGGLCCPVCTSVDLAYGAFEVSGLRGEHAVSCLACQAAWYDLYTLDGYYRLTRPEDTHGG